MQGTNTTVAYFNDPDNESSAETNPEMQEFLANVTEGDYVTVVYRTPSNGGSLHRTMGYVDNVRYHDGRFDDLHIDVEKSDRDEAGETAYLHVRPGTGQYYFSDNPGSDQDWGVKKVAWTPE